MSEKMVQLDRITAGLHSGIGDASSIGSVETTLPFGSAIFHVMADTPFLLTKPRPIPNCPPMPGCSLFWTPVHCLERISCQLLDIGCLLIGYQLFDLAC